jgi:hypothetical protein
MILRTKLLTISGIVIFLLACVSIYVFVDNRSESITVNNYNTYVKDLPLEHRSSINNALYLAVKLNLVDGEKIIKSPASIRKDTITNAYDEDRDVHSGSFIVDLKEIRQSYEVTYDWSEDKNNPNISGYPTTVKCLSNDEAILYKDFICKDGSESSGLPLENQLPYTDINGPFKIIYMYKQDNTDVIGVTNSTPNGRKKAIEWLKSKNIDPSSIIINYLDMRDQLRSFKYAAE